MSAPTETTSPEGPPGGTEFATDDPERAHAFLRATYVDHTMRITGSTAGFSMRHTNHDAGAFSMATLSHSMAVEHFNEPLGFVLVGEIVQGHLEREAPDHTLRMSPGDLFVFGSPELPFTVRWDAIEMRLTRISVDVLTPLGEPADGHWPRFTGLRPRTPGHARHLARILHYLAGDLLPNGEAMTQPLILAETTRLLTASVLTSFDNTALTEPGWRDQADPEPAVLRRAIAYIDAHAQDAITLADIAAAARVSPRAVQQAFRRYLETTPTAYLRRIRLDRAHQDLRAGDPARGDTVTAVAHRWGFLNVGRFAVLHQTVYGHSPNRALHG
jgi:AraC-like DNA-binding protein